MGECSDRQLAERIGRNQLHVGNRLAILALPVEEQELLRAGQMNLGDAVRRGRIASGRVRKANSTGHPHLGVEHDLARQARARCIRLGHKSKGRNSVGGVACGECWESVIRADERDQAHKHSAQLGHCVVCGTEQQAETA
jgi:ParB family chromosome partitioning protein